MRIAHLSDLHIRSPRAMKAAEFVTGCHPNRRFIGAANFLLRRNAIHSVDVLRAAVEAVSIARADHCVITGDVSNLAIDAEFTFVRSIIDGIGGPDRLSIVPGNHDWYTPEAVRAGLFEKHFGDLIMGRADVPVVYPAHKDFPECRLILAATATTPPPFFSWGVMDDRQMQAIRRLSDEAVGQGRFVVLAQHHHLHDRGLSLNELTGPFKDASRELAMLADSGIGLVIHGHDHKHRDWEFPSHHLSGRTRVVCCGSSTYFDPQGGRLGRMTVFEISENSLRVEKWKYQPEEGRFDLSLEG